MGPSKAAMLTPANGTALSATTVPFSWSAGSGATAYCLRAGHTPGATTYYDSGHVGSDVLMLTASGLPTDGSTVYVRLWSLVAGVWDYNDYSYTSVMGPSKAAMLTPANGTALSATSLPFGRRTGSGATAYCLRAGHMPGATTYYDSGHVGSDVLMLTASGLPTDGSTV